MSIPEKAYPKKCKILASEYATYRNDILEHFYKHILKKPCIFYDPMAGTAPLLPYLEVRGYTSYFNELLPVHYFANRAKSYTVFLKYRKNGKEWFQARLLELLLGLKDKKLHHSNEWINEDVLKVLIGAWNDTFNFQNEEAIFLKAIILISIRSLSSFTPSKNPTWFKPGGVSEDRDIYTIINNNIAKYENLYRTFYSAIGYSLPSKSKFTMNTAISNRIPKKAELIITSPPYANRLDLIRQFGPEIYFLSKVGYSVSTKDIIGTTAVNDYPALSSDYEFLYNNSQHLRAFFSKIRKDNEHGADYYLKYYCRFFSILVNTMISVLSQLSPIGKAYIVTQDNIHRGFCIEMDTVLREIFRTHGWSTRIIKKWERHHLGLQNVSRKHAFIKPRHFEKLMVVWR